MNLLDVLFIGVGNFIVYLSIWIFVYLDGLFELVFRRRNIDNNKGIV